MTIFLAIFLINRKIKNQNLNDLFKKISIKGIEIFIIKISYINVYQ